MQCPAALTQIDLGLGGGYRLPTGQWRIRLADVLLLIHRHRQVALRHGTLIQRYLAVHHYRTGTGVDDHFRIFDRNRDVDVLDIRQQAYLSPVIRRYADLNGTRIQRLGGTVTATRVNRIGNALRHREIFIVELQVNGVLRTKVTLQFTFYRRAAGNPATVQLVNLYAAAACRRTGTADQDVPLSQRIDLVIHPFHRSHQQRSAAQAFSVTQ